MIVKYKTGSIYSNTIEEIEVERETESSVWVRGKRKSKWGYEGYFDTWEGAREFLLGRADEELKSARRRLQDAQSKYGNIKGMKPK